MKYYIILFLIFLQHKYSFGQDSLCHPRFIENSAECIIMELKEEDDYQYILNLPLDSVLGSYHFSTENNYYLHYDSTEQYIHRAYHNSGYKGWFSSNDIEIPLQIYTYYKIHGIDTCFDHILKSLIATKIQKQRSERVKYIDRKTADSIDGIYIPKNINDCVRQLDIILSDTLKKKIKLMTKGEFVSKTHLGLGMSLRNQWGLWGGSRLRQYFISHNISHPDNMSGLILEYYYWHLVGKPTTLKKLLTVREIDNNKSKINNQKNEDKAFNQFQAGDSVTFNFRYKFISPKQKQSHEDDDCEALGIVLKRDVKKRYLFIKLIRACEPSGIIVEEYRVDKKGIYNIIWKGLMKEGEKRWFHYKDWESL
jgi:hypothetical protein